MPLNIKDPATERSVRALAAETGEAITTTIRKAVEDRLERVRRQRSSGVLKDELLAIATHCAALPDLDRRSADEILGYDDRGLPT
jgi:antitoxin VapB